MFSVIWSAREHFWVGLGLGIPMQCQLIELTALEAPRKARQQNCITITPQRFSYMAFLCENTPHGSIRSAPRTFVRVN